MTNTHEPPIGEAITAIITESLSSAKRFFVLGAFAPDALSAVLAARDAAWGKARRSTLAKQVVKHLATTLMDLPWSEHPAHAFFVAVLEQWEQDELERLIGDALREPGHLEVTHNAYLRAVLQGMAYPTSLGNSLQLMRHVPLAQFGEVMRRLLRTSLLDPTFSAAERRKLGVERPLTTQDRFALLSCVWQCQIGLTADLALDQHRRLWVTVDRVEHLLDYPPAERTLLINGLIHILATIPHFLTLWLNISTPDPQVVEEVKRAGGSQFWKLCDLDLTTGGGESASTTREGE